MARMLFFLLPSSFLHESLGQMWPPPLPPWDREYDWFGFYTGKLGPGHCFCKVRTAMAGNRIPAPPARCCDAVAAAPPGLSSAASFSISIFSAAEDQVSGCADSWSPAPEPSLGPQLLPSWQGWLCPRPFFYLLGSTPTQGGAPAQCLCPRPIRVGARAPPFTEKGRLAYLHLGQRSATPELWEPSRALLLLREEMSSLLWTALNPPTPAPSLVN